MSEEITNVDIDGFKIIRFDRDTRMTQKSIGGGLCMAVNTKWAVNFTVRETECSKHHEIMTVLFRPHYLPSEYTQITAILVYVPGPDIAFAVERIADCFNRAVYQSSDQPVFLLGDFNRCDVTTLLPNLEQYVTTPTRLDRMLDLCFGNIPGVSFIKLCVGSLLKVYVHPKAKFCVCQKIF